MKKIIIFLLILVFVFMSSGCACGVQETADKEMKVWVDKKTGVNYYIFCYEYGVGITPKLDKNGKPVITKRSNK